jgi:outer membrane immunogenic protein
MNVQFFCRNPTVKNFALSAAAIVLIGLTGAANASDMAVKAPAAAVTPAHNWSGWYAGLNAGGNWGTSQTSTVVSNGTTGVFFIPVAVNAINALGAPADFNASGFTGGVHGGYNYRLDKWLLGVEADFEYFRNAGSNTVAGLVGGAPATIASSVSTDWLFTLRPRVGIISNNWLIYGTGGLAVTELHANWNFLQTAGGLVTESAAVSTITPGWTVGGGVETALPGKFTLGIEYLYVNFPGVSTNNGAFLLPARVPSPIRSSKAQVWNLTSYAFA